MSNMARDGLVTAALPSKLHLRMIKQYLFQTNPLNFLDYQKPLQSNP
jgi:hypothetical protein